MSTLYLHQAWVVWLIIGVILLAGEFVTATLYSLSLSIAAFVTAAVASVLPSEHPAIIQAIVFFVVSAAFCTSVPRWLRRIRPAQKQFGLAAEIGHVYPLHVDHGECTVEIYGVRHLVAPLSVDPLWQTGDRVRIDGTDGGLLIVSRTA